MLKKIDHVGVAVQSIQEIKELFNNLFDMEPSFEEVVEDQKVRVAGYRVGESNFEFLEPLENDSPISKFLEKRGEGIHHIAVTVSDIHQLLEKLKQKGIKLIDENPRKGAEGKWIAFAHPKSFHGILLEFSQSEEA
ncbi:MAG: methylmalonyl-CoA epimerase [Calditrichia bacterium]